MIAGVALAVIVTAVTISTRRPVAIAETKDDPAAIAPPPTAPGEAVEDTIEVEVNQPQANPTNSGRH